MFTIPSWMKLCVTQPMMHRIVASTFLATLFDLLFSHSLFWTTLPAVLVLGVFFSRPGFIWNSSLHSFHSCFGQPPHLESPTISTSFPLGLAYQSHRPPLETIPSLSRDVGITHKLFYPYFFSE